LFALGRRRLRRRNVAATVSTRRPLVSNVLSSRSWGWRVGATDSGGAMECQLIYTRQGQPTHVFPISTRARPATRKNKGKLGTVAQHLRSLLRMATETTTRTCLRWRLSFFTNDALVQGIGRGKKSMRMDRRARLCRSDPPQGSSDRFSTLFSSLACALSTRGAGSRRGLLVDRSVLLLVSLERINMNGSAR
jgi:hypothetical protein